jgi:hypothetical protein
MAFRALEPLPDPVPAVTRSIEMRLRNAMIAALSLSMTATPVLAQSAAPLSVAQSLERAGPEMDGASNMRRDIGVAIAFFAIAIGLVVLLSDGDEDSTSP